MSSADAERWQFTVDDVGEAGQSEPGTTYIWFTLSTHDGCYGRVRANEGQLVEVDLNVVRDRIAKWANDRMADDSTRTAFWTDLVGPHGAHYPG